MAAFVEQVVGVAPGGVVGWGGTHGDEAGGWHGGVAPDQRKQH